MALQSSAEAGLCAGSTVADFSTSSDHEVNDPARVRLAPDVRHTLQVCGNKGLVAELLSWLRTWQPGSDAAAADATAMTVAATAPEDVRDGSDTDDEWLRVSTLRQMHACCQ